MNSNEIVYERKMTGSFMKLRCDEVRPLAEDQAPEILR